MSCPNRPPAPAPKARVSPPWCLIRTYLYSSLPGLTSFVSSCRMNPLSRSRSRMRSNRTLSLSKLPMGGQCPALIIRSRAAPSTRIRA